MSRKSKSVSTPYHTSAPISACAISSEPLWTKNEAADYLRVKPSTIYQLTRKRCRLPLPYLPCGKYLRFRKSEIDRWLEECRSAA
jgi:excisionase family DNA binding protein